MELIKIYKGSLVDARELHQFLEVKRDFSTWIKVRIKKYDFEEGSDYTTAPRFGGAVHKGGGHNKIDYALTLNMAKELAMVENNEKGKRARKYFIEAEAALKELSENKRLSAFLKLEATKDKLLNNLKNLGGTDDDFLQIDTNGRRVLFNGTPLPDEELPRILLLSRDLASEMTNLNIKESNPTIEQVNDINEINHQGVRDYIIESTGKTPESLPKEKDLGTLKNKNKKGLEK